jgi:small subunit ribosomal protein S9
LIEREDQTGPEEVTPDAVAPDPAPSEAESAPPDVESAPPDVESAPPAVESAPPAVESTPPAEDATPAQEAPAPEEAPAAEPAAPTAPEAETTEQPAEPEPQPTRTLQELAADARYFATGKRKTAVARVIIKPGSGQFELNGRALEVYFPRRVHQVIVRQPLEIVGFAERVDVRARIHGGGISGQADAVRHGIAKALIEADPGLRGELKRRQLLTRDPREKERRKAGLKKARKRPQFSKR